MGESQLLRGGINLPAKSDTENSTALNEQDFVVYEIAANEGERTVEELYVKKGVCVVSEGSLGGPCNLKSLYRPQISYGTGFNLKSILKTQFLGRGKDGFIHDSCQNF